MCRAQRISVTSLFSCFLRPSYSLHSKYFSITREEYEEVSIGSRNDLSGAGKAGSVNKWSEEERSRMTGDEDNDVEYYDLG